jgi:hypothetical protein
MGNGNCIEARLIGGAVEVRDSKDRMGHVLRFSPDQWTGLISAITRGQLDSTRHH